MNLFVCLSIYLFGKVSIDASTDVLPPRSPKATVTDEVPLTTAEVLADEPLDGEDQWSDEELGQRA